MGIFVKQFNFEADSNCDIIHLTLDQQYSSSPPKGKKWEYPLRWLARWYHSIARDYATKMWLRKEILQRRGHLMVASLAYGNTQILAHSWLDLPDGFPQGWVSFWKVVEIKLSRLPIPDCQTDSWCNMTGFNGQDRSGLLLYSPSISLSNPGLLNGGWIHLSFPSALEGLPLNSAKILCSWMEFCNHKAIEILCFRCSHLYL